MKASTAALYLSLSCNLILFVYVLTRDNFTPAFVLMSPKAPSEKELLRPPPALGSDPTSKQQIDTVAAAVPQANPSKQNDSWQKHMESAPALKMLRLQQATSIDVEYQPLFSRIKLSADRRQMLRELLSERRAASIHIAMNVSLLSPDDTKELGIQNEASFQAQVLRSLGRDVQTKIIEFDARLPDEAAANRISRAVEVLGTSISAEQQETLAVTLNAAGWAKTIGSAGDEKTLRTKTDAAKAAIQSSNTLSSDQKTAVLSALDEDIALKLLKDHVYAKEKN